jgi:hypothetical protein
MKSLIPVIICLSTGAAVTPLLSNAATAKVMLAQSSGQAAGTEGGAGQAGASGTPPAQLKRDEEARQQIGNTSSTHAPSVPEGASHTAQGSK